MAFAVATPAELAAANAVALKVSVTSRVPVAAAFAFAGWVPERTWIVPPLRSAQTASAAAFAPASARNGLLATWGLLGGWVRTLCRLLRPSRAAARPPPLWRSRTGRPGGRR